MQHIDFLIEHFGYLGIIVVLIGGIVGLPIPDEVLLTYVGYNVFQGKFLTKNLFQKVGPTVLLVGYFVPGVRHFAAYIAAVNKYPFKKFVVYAYSGALLWSFTFISLGRVLGEQWHLVESYISKYSVYFIMLVLVLAIVLYIFWKRRSQLRSE
ncbi:VTT domain-containing protein [Niallia oryzisoli]|uniref:VTT domain-containing protein n=1 Tax=Niallia oryzisoli TaxID=1737571 RepID=A0ABZ2CKM7_9BACI